MEGVRRVVDWLDRRGQIEDADTCPAYDAIIDAWERLGSCMVDELAHLDL